MQAITVGQNHVAEDQADVLTFLLKHAQRFIRARGGEHLVPLLTQHSRRKTPHLRLILHQQDPLPMPQELQNRGLLHSLLRRGFFRPRQANVDYGALAEFAPDVDPAAMLLHDPIDHRQPQAGAVLLGGEKGFIEMLDRLRPHPLASVLDRQTHKVPGARVRVPGALCRIDVCLACADHQPPAVRHRVPRVHRQVHDHLLHLPGVRLDAAQKGVHVGDHLDVLADQTPQHPLRVADDYVQVQHLNLQHLLAAEGQQLPCERGRSAAGACDLLRVAPQRALRVEALHQQIAVPQDRRQHVVKVMGDAGRQLAHRRQPLLPLDELLSLPLPGHVAPNQHTAARLRARLHRPRRRLEHPPRRPGDDDLVPQALLRQQFLQRAPP